MGPLIDLGGDEDHIQIMKDSRGIIIGADQILKLSIESQNNIGYETRKKLIM